MQNDTMSRIDPRASNAVRKIAQEIARGGDSSACTKRILQILVEALALSHISCYEREKETGDWLVRYHIDDASAEAAPRAAGASATGTIRLSALPADEFSIPIQRETELVGHLGAERGVPSQLDDASCEWALNVAAPMISQQMFGQTGVVSPEQRPMDAAWRSEDAHATAAAAGIFGRNIEVRAAVEKAMRVAHGDSTVLMTGERGAGKERLARMIHLASARRDNPFICLDCATSDKELLEVELFGCEPTDAASAMTDRIGKFEQAAGGTLYLDEIADMPLELQAKVLRALQEKVIRRVGSTRDIAIHVRVIAATDRNLQDLVEVGQFDIDLFYRLNGVEVRLPPLRDRRGDVRTLALTFLARENQRYARNVALSEATLEHLERYDWPGNVAELENAIERAVIASDKEILLVDDMEAILEVEANTTAAPMERLRGWLGLPMNRLTQRSAASLSDEKIRPYMRVSEEERRQIEEMLQAAKGNKTLAARQLGLTTRQLHYRLSKLGMKH